MSEISSWQIILILAIVIPAVLVFLPIKQSIREDAEIWPWKRFFARAFDTNIYVVIFFLLALILALMGLELFDESTLGLVILGAVVAAVILECIFLNTFGTTPGKWLLKVELNKTEIPFGLALSRTSRIAIRQIPLISLFFYWRIFRVLKKTGDTSYDRNTGFEVTAQKTTKGRMTAFVIIYLVLSILVGSANTLSRIDQNILQEQSSVFSNDDIYPNEFLKLVAT